MRVMTSSAHTPTDASMFDRKVGVKRTFGQGYHDRYIFPELSWREVRPSYYAGKKGGQAFQPDVSGKSGWKA